MVWGGGGGGGVKMYTSSLWVNEVLMQSIILYAGSIRYTVKLVNNDHLWAKNEVALIGRWCLYGGQNQLYTHYWDTTKWSL